MAVAAVAGGPVRVGRLMQTVCVLVAICSAVAVATLAVLVVAAWWLMRADT